MNRTSNPFTQTRRCCYFSGRVQGVGFRFTVQNIAQRYNVYGYVRNLPDGRVELIMEGDPSEMDLLLSDVTEKMNCYIKGVDTNLFPPTGEFDDFFVRH